MNLPYSTEAAVLARHHNELRAFIELVAGKPLTPAQAAMLESLLSSAPIAQTTTN
jgi:hypothetical protein